jgi:FlaA1/EpsC-like NDP-sugar epimerase
MDAILAFGGVFGLRVLRRIFYDRQARQAEELRYAHRAALRRKGQSKRPVLLIGAGRAGVLAAKEIKAHGHLEIEIKGFVDDDPRKLGQVIYGVKVLGDTTDLPRLARKLGIEHAVITIAEASGREIRRVLKICEQIPLKVRIIPALYEILSGQAEVSRIRDVQIEDLLGRAPVALDEASMRRLLAGKRVLVTGAGGSIGAELARQVARLQPSSLLLVERCECALFDSERELRRAYPELTLAPLVADVSDETRMRQIFAAHQPQVVLHAAAHKHVPLMEGNAAEAIKNNVLGTRLLAELADVFEIAVFVLISTDKAVRPTSVMGASKRVAELVIQDLNRHSETRFVAVRFGNVIGSAGSVIPIFREQIRRGGPLTVTHPEMMRYFMTIPEAAQLVLQAGAIGAGGEIFILDMGEPVRILDLAKDLIRLSGLRPFEDIDINFTGMRSGEKLFEELQMSEEGMTRTRHPKIFIGKIVPYPELEVRYALERLSYLAYNGQEHELRRFLNEFLPEARLQMLSESGALRALGVPPSGGERRAAPDYAPAAHLTA